MPLNLEEFGFSADQTEYNRLIQAGLTERDVLLLLLLNGGTGGGGVGNFIPEILSSGTHEGPFVQMEGHGGDAVLTSAECEGSDTDWAGQTIYSGIPIEGPFSDVVIASGELLAYKRRA